jgi:hypothetical protein
MARLLEEIDWLAPALSPPDDGTRMTNLLGLLSAEGA